MEEKVTLTPELKQSIIDKIQIILDRTHSVSEKGKQILTTVDCKLHVPTVVILLMISLPKEVIFIGKTVITTAIILHVNTFQSLNF